MDPIFASSPVRASSQEECALWNNLVIAARNGDEMAVATMLDKPLPKGLADCAIRTAADWGRTSIVSMFVEHGTDVTLNDSEVLRHAARRGHADTIELLIKNGADIHARNDCALQWTVVNDHPEAASVLMKNGADKKMASKLIAENKDGAAAAILAEFISQKHREKPGKAA